MTVAVVGASGFIGRAVVSDLEAAGQEVRRISGLRVSGEIDPRTMSVFGDPKSRGAIRDAIEGCHCVINAAGDPNASSTDQTALLQANALLPGLLAEAVSDVPGARFVHVSSAVVQGRAAMLTDSDEFDVFSPYAVSKAEGERAIRRACPERHVIYRPPSVHAPDRRVSRSVVRLAESPLRSVAAPPTSPSPQALVENVASAIAFLATCTPEPPSVVIHPWEGMTTGGLMRVLGGREPRVLPQRFASRIVQLLERAGRRSGPIATNARRVEMMWFGQGQDRSWLTGAGWTPPVGIEGWEELRMRIKTEAARGDMGGTDD
ncbi:NAD-dependent epimerase/dehydratase family protein [Terrabacter sp. C0L_2]|uniref:NAD-dependent epimerase/dehydratase family protein n=1 Tax=Terrabacter sp. C0L_2 TaxID=3108389 RepID=UPI002ED37E09|nr:NAD-dependent epimerase/dehydratase family protein [Terrabacter sp. C0L_2]